MVTKMYKRCPFPVVALLLLTMVGGILGGCGSKKVDPLLEAAHFPSMDGMSDAERAAEEARLRGLRDDEEALRRFHEPDPETGSVAERAFQGEFPDARMTPELEPIFFPFDSDDLLPETKARMRNHVTYLAANPGLSVLLRGHTDERGTEEYNLALGSRRALAVREYLVSEGIAPGRIHTISLGLYEPADVSGSDESHARNRRVEFLVFETE